MTNPVIKYTQASSSIPQLTGQAPSGVLMLDYILAANNYTQVATDGANKRVWRTNNTSTARPYIRAEDAGTYIKVVTGEGYTNIDTLVNYCPTVAQRANGFTLLKSDTASSATRNFTAYVSDRGFCIFTVPVSGSLDNKFLYIGEYETRLAAEAGTYNWVTIGAIASSSSSDHQQGNYIKTVGYPQVYIPRAKDLSVGAQISCVIGMETFMTSGSYIGQPSVQTYQESDPVSGGLLGPIALYVLEPSTSRHIRGRVYGLWELPWASSDATLVPPGPITSTMYPGRSWRLFRHIAGMGNWCIEESNWYGTMICQAV